jgi:hypothetical protein
MLMDVLLIATGFSGAMTLLWLARLVARRYLPATGASVHFGPGPGPIEAMVREIAVARHEVLLMAEVLACRPIAQALVDARLKQMVQVNVLLAAASENHPTSDLPFLIEQGLLPIVADEQGQLGAPIVLVDGKTVAIGSIDFTGTETPAGQLAIVRGQADLAAACREQFAARRGKARAVVGGGTTPRTAGPPE